MSQFIVAAASGSLTKREPSVGMTKPICLTRLCVSVLFLLRLQ